ncbi:hypothetical protein ACTFIW_011114 [Dictyostelium discoideum]
MGNNSNNNNNVENRNDYENDIDNSELEKKSLKSIKEIAQSYSISITKLKKAEIIEKIKSIVKRKREYEEEEKQKENVNSFNKIIKLTITDNIEPTEILFWKLFKSNQYIKRKVYRNCKYLHFHPNQYYNGIADVRLFVKLFSTIKEDDDYRFYRNFFNIDNDYYSLNKFIKYILELNSPNSVLFDTKLVDTDFRDFHSVGNDRIYVTKKDTFSKGFLCYLNNIKIDDSHRDQYYQLLIGPSIQDSYSGIRFQINEKSTLKTLITTAILILKLKTPPPSSSSSSSLDLKVEEERKVKEEDEEDEEEEEEEEVKEEKKKEKVFPKKIEAVETIEEVDNFIKKIDKVNLKSLLDDPINFSNYEIKNFIKKLLKLYYSIFDCKVSNILYFCYYHEQSNDDDDDYKTLSPDYLIESAFRFGIYEILESCESIGCERFLPVAYQEPFNSNGYKVFLFSHCFNKEKKIKFIDQIIARGATSRQDEPGFQISFLYLLVIHNDIELVKYYSNKVGSHRLTHSCRKILIIPPTYYIESIEMLEYLFYNQCYYFKDVFFLFCKSAYYKNLELLKHFESLLEKSKILNQLGYGYGGSIDYDIYMLLMNYADFAKHFASNPQIYNSDKLDHNQLFSLFTTTAVPSSSSSSFTSKISINFEILRNLLINANDFARNPITEIAKPTPTHVLQNPYSKEYLKFLDCMYLNYNHHGIEEDQGGQFLAMNEERYKYHLLIAIDRLNLNNENYFDGNQEENGIYIERLSFLTNDVIRLTPYLYEINNFKFLNWFLTIIKKYHNSSTPPTIQHQQNLSIKEMIYAFMEYITLNSKLQILEYIHQNFNFILKKKINGGILNINNLKSFLFSSLNRGSIKISKFLFQFITITKNEFEKNSNEKTKPYFENMFK